MILLALPAAIHLPPSESWTSVVRFFHTWSVNILLALVYFVVATLFIQITLRILHFIRNRTPWDFGLRLLRRESSGATFSLVSGLITYGVYIVTTLLVLRRAFGVDTTALVTASGIVGLAIGFGTQGLVRDFVSGLLLVVDGGIRPGDVVDIGGQTGVVEAVNFRTTTLRDAQGEIRQVPNGSIGAIVNYGQQGLEAVVDLFVEEGVKLDQPLERLRQAVADLWQLSPFFEPGFTVEALSLPASGTTVIEVAVRLLPARRPLVDQLLVPTLRDAAAKASLPLHEGRVTVYYREPRLRPHGGSAGGPGGQGAQGAAGKAGLGRRSDTGPGRALDSGLASAKRLLTGKRMGRRSDGRPSEAEGERKPG